MNVRITVVVEFPVVSKLSDILAQFLWFFVVVQMKSQNELRPYILTVDETKAHRNTRVYKTVTFITYQVRGCALKIGLNTLPNTGSMHTTTVCLIRTHNIFRVIAVAVFVLSKRSHKGKHTQSINTSGQCKISKFSHNICFKFTAALA